MKYYNVQDIKDLTGLSQSKCYGIIRELNKSYKKAYPNAVLAQGSIPVFWFEQAMGIKKENINEKGEEINENR